MPHYRGRSQGLAAIATSFWGGFRAAGANPTCRSHVSWSVGWMKPWLKDGRQRISNLNSTSIYPYLF